MEKKIFHTFGMTCIRMLSRANDSALGGEFNGQRLVMICVTEHEYYTVTGYVLVKLKHPLKSQTQDTFSTFVFDVHYMTLIL